MKLFYITSHRLPTTKAHGYQIAKMCEAFTDFGLDVNLIVPNRKNPDRSCFSDYYKLKQKIKIIYLPCCDLAFIKWYFLRYWIMILTFSLSLKLFLFKNQHSEYKLYIRESLLALLVKDFIMEVHMLPDKIRWYHKWLWGRAKSFSVLTSFIKVELGNIFPNKKIIISPDGVDLNDFKIRETKNEIRQKLNLPLDKKIILYSGSFYLYDWKGVDIALSAAGYFGDDHLFVLVGGQLEDIEKIKRRNYSNNIKLINFRPHSEVPFYQQAADVLLLPNKSGDKLSSQCTSPLKLFEYMASGNPIVASDLPSTREILNDENSILVEPDSAQTLSQGIKRVLSDKKLGAQLANQARVDVQKFTWENRARLIIEDLLNQ